MAKKKKMSVFVMAMMNLAIVMSLRGLPLMAKEGVTMIFYILFSSVLFLMPVSLVSAELATGWPEHGGVYRWVKEAFGSKLGFTAIWLQWVQNTIWYTTVLAFAAGALSYLFLDPALAENKFFIIVVILAVYWGATFINFRGISFASWLTTIFVIFGTIIPAVLIILLGISWVVMGHPLEFMQGMHTFLPDFTDFNKVAFLAGTILLFSGMEVGAVHVKELNNPKNDYPKAVFIAMLLIIIVFFLGSFSVAAVLSLDQISLTAGIMQGFRELLHIFHLDFLLPMIGFLVAFGAIGGVIAWIGGPSKGLLATAKNGELPPFLQYTNKHGMQTHILWVQGVIVTILSFVFLLLPNVNNAFFLLTSLTATLYLIMYVLLYAAAICLRYKKPNVPRAYKIPGGKFGMWLVAGIGILAVLFGIVVSFFPPSQLHISRPEVYTLFVLIGSIVFVTLPILINYFKKPEWKKSKK